ncbi:MAG: hypothetical protein OEZ16_11000 [Chromatiales bacterium]|nr:hypothetical protein [Chromatiales bacterium]
MLFGLLPSRPLLDEPSITWLFDTYGWALRHFDATIFRDHTVLVEPSDRFFPGRVDSVEGMAQLICDRVKGYAAIGHWPTRLFDARQCQIDTPRLLLEGPIRQVSAGESDAAVEEAERLPIPYDPLLVNNPEGMIASFAHTFAHYLSTLASAPPPGGEESWSQVTEVVATFLGFGLPMANSAFNVRIPRCGACAPQPVDRQSFLSQYDTTYALAIFCTLKAIPNNRVLPLLKGSLRSFYKKAVKDVARREQQIAQLRQLM